MDMNEHRCLILSCMKAPRSCTMCSLHIFYTYFKTPCLRKPISRWNVEVYLIDSRYRCYLHAAESKSFRCDIVCAAFVIDVQKRRVCTSWRMMN